MPSTSYDNRYPFLISLLIWQKKQRLPPFQRDKIYLFASHVLLTVSQTRLTGRRKVFAPYQHIQSCKTRHRNWTSSVDSESTFYIVGKVINPCRIRFGDDNIIALIFKKSWMMFYSNFHYYSVPFSPLYTCLSILSLIPSNTHLPFPSPSHARNYCHHCVLSFRRTINFNGANH